MLSEYWTMSLDVDDNIQELASKSTFSIYLCILTDYVVYVMLE